MRTETFWFMTAVSAAAAWISDRLGYLFQPVCVLLLAMVIDYITGMLASKAEAIQHPEDPAYGWSSRVGILGVLKKLGYMGIVTVAVIFDYLLVHAAAQMGIDTPTTVFFGLLVTVWLILNELLSIAENCGRMGAPVPKWLLRRIAILKERVDEQGEAGEGSSDE